MTTIKTRKKLIEVALPLEAINVASAKEKTIRHGHPSTIHLYWARRPLATARAVIFAQMVDDPSANTDLFPTEKSQDKERQRLFKIIENLVKWENTNNEAVLQTAREEIWASWRRACADNVDHPQFNELFNRANLPGFHDPFAGGGALPLEAQRLGLESHATDLNPVSVIINKAMIELPPKFVGRPPVNPGAKNDKALFKNEWKGASGLYEDVRYYGNWMRDEAEKRLKGLYPRVQITKEMAIERPDLKQYECQELTVIAWVWARTVKSPNPAFSSVDVPLASTFMLSTKSGKEAYVEPITDKGGYRFEVKIGKPTDVQGAKLGTKLSRGANFKCLMSGAPMAPRYIKDEGKAGRMGSRLMAIVAEGARGRVYLSPTPEHEEIALKATPKWKPETPLPEDMRSHWTPPYGLSTYGDLFTPRQLVALTTFSDLVHEALVRIQRDALESGMTASPAPLRDGGLGAKAYAEAVAVYLAILVDKMAFLGSSISYWEPAAQCPRGIFGRQAIPMTWDYAEPNVFSDSSGSWTGFIKSLLDGVEALFNDCKETCGGSAIQADASRQNISYGKVISTDPPYYDNIGYADLSDYFYVWLRRSLQPVFPELFATISVPKAEELVATPYRHGGKEMAESFFLEGMTQAMNQLANQAHPAFPVTIYYAFKQSESGGDGATSSTGWETFLDAVIRAGFATAGTWPMRTEMTAALKDSANVLASSIVLVCRKREASLPIVARRDFITALKAELPSSLRHLQEGNIAPVDLAQASIGPGIEIYTRYSKVMGADGNPLTVRDALVLINEVLDEQLAAQEVNWDADTRWAVEWFDQSAFLASGFGLADTLARAKNTSVAGVVEAGIANSGSGKVRLLKPEELPVTWTPEADGRLTVWEMLHHLIRLQKDGEAPVAAMLSRLGDKADSAKELAYRLYGICEKKKRSIEGQLYNDLIVVWPDLVARSKEAPAPAARPGELNLDN